MRSPLVGTLIRKQEVFKRKGQLPFLMKVEGSRIPKPGRWSQSDTQMRPVREMDEERVGVAVVSMSDFGNRLVQDVQVQLFHAVIL